MPSLLSDESGIGLFYEKRLFKFNAVSFRSFDIRADVEV